MTDPRPHAWNSTLRVPRKRIKSSGPIERRAEMPKSNAKRRAKLYKRNFGAYADLIREMPCCTCGAPGPSEASHARARGMGGCGGSKRDLVPQCGPCHRAYEAGKETFQRERGVDLAAIAAELWAQYGGGEG